MTKKKTSIVVATVAIAICVIAVVYLARPPGPELTVCKFGASEPISGGHVAIAGGELGVVGREDVKPHEGKCFVAVLTRRQGELTVTDDSGKELGYVGAAIKKTGPDSFTVGIGYKMKVPNGYIIHVFDAPTDIKSVSVGQEKVAFADRAAFNEALRRVKLAGDK